MPRQVSQSKAKPSHADRVRRFLTGGGVAREDSDDELGLEDHPWKWIYATSSQSRNSSSVDEADGNREEKIVGARMGEFECRIGDCVLLKAEGTSNEAWIGIICEFQDDEEKGEKAANFMWFSTEREIRNKQKKRTDAMQVRSGFGLDHVDEISLNLSGRMKFILLLHGTSIRWYLSTAKLQLFLRVHSASASPLAKSLEPPRIVAKFLFVVEAVIRGPLPIRMNSIGRRYIVAQKTSMLWWSESKRRPEVQEKEKGMLQMEMLNQGYSPVSAETSKTHSLS